MFETAAVDLRLSHGETGSFHWGFLGGRRSIHYFVLQTFLRNGKCSFTLSFHNMFCVSVWTFPLLINSVTIAEQFARSKRPPHHMRAFLCNFTILPTYFSAKKVIYKANFPSIILNNLWNIVHSKLVEELWIWSISDAYPKSRTGPWSRHQEQKNCGRFALKSVRPMTNNTLQHSLFKAWILSWNVLLFSCNLIGHLCLSDPGYRSHPVT